MSFKKIILCFYIGLPICIIARVLQVVLAIEYSNGFYFEEYKNVGNLMLFSIFAVCVILAICAFKAYKTPENPPETNLPLSVSALGVALALIYELFCEKLPATSVLWQVRAVKIVTVICVAYFLAFALQDALKIKISPILHVIPFFYVAAKTIFNFINISSLALISDNILLMAGYCLLMLFFINYGKLYNKLDTDLNFRKILSTGLVTSIICSTQSIAYFVVNIVSVEKYLHADLSVILTLLSFGIFSIVFIISHFYKTA